MVDTDDSAALQVLGHGATFPATLYQSMAFAYNFVQTDAELSYSAEGGLTGIGDLLANRIPFAAVDMDVPVEYYTQADDLQLYPTVAGAVVPVVNLPELAQDNQSIGAEALTLSGEVLARIFMGNITRWNDPAIVALNTQVANLLPTQPIIVCVRADQSGTTAIFTRALARMSHDFRATVGASALPNWGEYITANRILPVVKNEGLAARVLITPYSIGYVVYEAAVMRGLTIPRLRKASGSVVKAGTVGVSHAVLDAGADVSDQFTADLTSTASPHAWPICGYTYLAVRLRTMPPGQSCEHRRAVVEFWTWFYTTDSVRLSAEDMGFATLPSFVRDSVLAHMHERVVCTDNNTAGVPAYSPEVSEAVFGSGTEAGKSLMATLGKAFGFVDDGVDVTYTTQPWTRHENINRRLQSFASRAAFAVFLQNGVELTVDSVVPYQQNALDHIVVTDSDPPLPYTTPVLLAPVALVGGGVVYNLPSLAGHTLVFDLTTIAAIFSDQITQWNDPVIASLNPEIRHLLPAEPIQVVVQSGSSEATGMLSRTLTSLAPTHTTGGITASSIDDWPSRFIRVESPDRLASTVHALVHAVGFLFDSENLKVPVSRIRLPGACGGDETPYCDVDLSASTIAACANQTFDVSTGLFTFTMNQTLPGLTVTAPPSTTTRCWPFSTVINVAVPSAFTAREGELCYDGKRLVEFLQWIHTSPSVRTAITQVKSVPLQSAVRTAIRAKLRSITCNSQPVGRVFCRRGEQRVSDSVCVPCPAGTFDREGDGQCDPCPSGALCKGGASLAALSGFWQGADNRFFRCSSGICCPSGECDLERAAQSAAYAAEHPRCIDRHDNNSTLCASCEPGNSFFAGRCRECKAVNWWFVAALLATGVVVVLCIVNLGGNKFAFFELWTDYLQLVGLIIGGERLAALYLQVFSLDPSVLSYGDIPCIAPMSRYMNHILSILWPVWLLLLMLAFYGVGRIQRCIQHRRLPAHRRSRPPLRFLEAAVAQDSKYLQGAWRLIIIAYTALSQTGLSFFSCVQIDDVSVMVANHGIQCGTPEHAVAQAVGGTLVLTMTLVLPVSISLLMHRANGGQISWVAFKRGIMSVVADILHKSKHVKRSSMQALQFVFALRKRAQGRSSATSVGPTASEAEWISPADGELRRRQLMFGYSDAVMRAVAKFKSHRQPRETVFRLMLQSVSDWIRPEFRLWFEPYFLLRRTVMICLSMFIVDERTRACMLLAWAVTLLYLHTLLRPFATLAKNTAHGALSTALVLVAGLDIAARNFNGGGVYDTRTDVTHAIYVIILLPALPLTWYFVQTIFKSDVGMKARELVARAREAGVRAAGLRHWGSGELRTSIGNWARRRSSIDTAAIDAIRGGLNKSGGSEADNEVKKKQKKQALYETSDSNIAELSTACDEDPRSDSSSDQLHRMPKGVIGSSVSSTPTDKDVDADFEESPYKVRDGAESGQGRRRGPRRSTVDAPHVHVYNPYSDTFSASRSPEQRRTPPDGPGAQYVVDSLSDTNSDIDSDEDTGTAHSVPRNLSQVRRSIASAHTPPRQPPSDHIKDESGDGVQGFSASSSPTLSPQSRPAAAVSPVVLHASRLPRQSNAGSQSHAATPRRESEPKQSARGAEQRPNSRSKVQPVWEATTGTEVADERLPGSSDVTDMPGGIGDGTYVESRRCTLIRLMDGAGSFEDLQGKSRVSQTQSLMQGGHSRGIRPGRVPGTPDDEF